MPRSNLEKHDKLDPACRLRFRLIEKASSAPRLGVGGLSNAYQKSPKIVSLEERFAKSPPKMSIPRNPSIGEYRRNGIVGHSSVSQMNSIPNQSLKPCLCTCLFFVRFPCSFSFIRFPTDRRRVSRFNDGTFVSASASYYDYNYGYGYS
jgi:hypothetical protein